MVPQVELGWGPIHVQVNEALGLGREVRKSRQWWMNPRNRRIRSTQQLARSERGECQSAKADACIAKKLTSGLIQLKFEQRIHSQLRVTVSSRLSSKLAVSV